MIADKHPLGKFEFKITQNGNNTTSSDNSPFGTSLAVFGSTTMYGGNVNQYIRGTYLRFQYAESTVASNRSPVPPAREDVYNVEMYDEYPLVGLREISLNRHNSYTQFVDIKGIEEFLQSGRATALAVFRYIFSSLLLPVPTERLINIFIENNISCLRFDIAGTPAGNSFGAVGSVANIAYIPLIEYVEVYTYCAEFPDLLPAASTLVRLSIGSPSGSSSRQTYCMTGEIGDLRGMWRLTSFDLQYFNGMQHEYYLPVSLTVFRIDNVYNNQNLPENWLDLANIREVNFNNFLGASTADLDEIYIDHLSNLELLILNNNTKFYLSTEALLPDSIIRIDLNRQVNATINIDIPDLDKPNLNYVTIIRYGYKYNSANRPKKTPRFQWQYNNTQQADLDQILTDFLADIIAGEKIAGTKSLNIQFSHTNQNLFEYPTNNITEITILNGGNSYVVGDILTTPTVGSGAIIQVVGGTNPSASSLTNSGATLSIINSGSGYSVNNYLRVKRISNNGNSGIVRVTSVDTFGGITGLTVTSAGGSYDRNLDYDLLSGIQSSVEITSVDGTGKITSISIVNGGSEYHTDQTVWLGGTGTGASLRGRTDARRIVQYGYTVTY